VPPGHNITADAGALATVKCISHYGNPPATLKWFLGKCTPWEHTQRNVASLCGEHGKGNYKCLLSIAYFFTINSLFFQQHK